MELSELVGSIEQFYSEEQQKQILEYFWKAKKHSHIPNSPLLFDLIKKGFIKITEKKYISYRLEKFFNAKNIEKISERKEFIFKQLPTLDGLERKRNASYDDVIDFISENYYNLFDEILTDFKTYQYGDMVGENGYNLTLYLYRKVGNGSNYQLNPQTNDFELKNDEVSKLLLERGYKFEKPQRGGITIDISDILNNSYKKVLEKNGILTNENNEKIIKYLKIFLLVVLTFACFPLMVVIGLFYLFKKYKN